MQMNFQTLHHLYSERLPEIEKGIDIKSNGDLDLRQEGLLGAYRALQTDPRGTKRFLLNKATWEMVSSLRKGKSVDNGFYKRKNHKIIHPITGRQSPHRGIRPNNYGRRLSISFKPSRNTSKNKTVPPHLLL
jgi:hypothetical protein